MSAPFLLQLAGLPGSGKSALGRLIATRTGAVLLDKDVLKTAALDAGAGDSLAGQIAYESFFALAAHLLGQDVSVVLDSPSFYDTIPAKGAAIAAERLASDRPWLVLVNGASRSIDAAHVATAAKRISPPPFVLAYGPHVRLAELAGPLREAGADRVVANSAIHERLPAIVRQRLDAALDVPASERA